MILILSLSLSLALVLIMLGYDHALHRDMVRDIYCVWEGNGGGFS